MSLTKRQTTYFVKPGRENTDSLLRLVKEYSKKEKIGNIVISSSTGETGVKAARTFKGAIGGTGTGVDTALQIKPANASSIFDLKIREIIAKPRDF